MRYDTIRYGRYNRSVVSSVELCRVVSSYVKWIVTSLKRKTETKSHTRNGTEQTAVDRSIDRLEKLCEMR